MESRHEEINKLLDIFDGFQNDVNIKKTIVKSYLDKLRSKLNQNPNSIMKGSKFCKIGSSYENTVVSPSADFDIEIILPHPFVMDFFESTKTIYSGFYKLKCVDDARYFDSFVNSNDFLLVKQLRDKIFEELIAVIKKVSFEGYTITCFEMNAAVRAILKNSSTYVKIDIAPHIGGNIFDDDIPEWDGDIAPVIKTFMDSTDHNVLFNLSCPPDLKDENYSHLVVQPAFGLIEKEYMLKSYSIREAVRISKAVVKHNKWAEDGIRSFHIKQTALSLYNEIKDLDPWQGYTMIMKELISMLKEGGVDGCFIKDHNIITKDEDECRKLAKKIQKVVKSIQPNNILQRLDYM